MALSSLRAHKLRSILTMLGIIIGVGSVIAVVAIGQGGEQVLKSQLTGESNTIELLYLPSDEELEANPASLYEDAFTQEDIKLIESIPEVERVAATSTESSLVRHRQESTDGMITGINQAYIDVHGLEITEGRNLMPADFLSGARVAVATDGLQEDLFEDENESLLGKIIYIDNQPVEIIGVVESETGFFSFGSNTIYIPMKTWQSIYAKTSVTEVSIQAKSVDDLQIAGEKAADMLNQIHDKEDSYQVLNMEEIAEGIGQITRIMTIIISSIAGVSLLVGGIGVMNIMLVSVTERTREIGIRMSLGATRGQILFQFLVEAMTLTLIGGLIGMVLGTGTAYAVSYFAGWPPLVSLPVIIGGILFSMLIGIIFGLLPANKASRLDPIESLRYE